MRIGASLHVAHLPAHLDAIHVGKAEVEDHERRELCSCNGERIPAGRRFTNHAVERLQQVRHGAPDLALVVYDEEERSGGHRVEWKSETSRSDGAGRPPAPA